MIGNPVFLFPKLNNPAPSPERETRKVPSLVNAPAQARCQASHAAGCSDFRFLLIACIPPTNTPAMPRATRKSTMSPCEIRMAINICVAHVDVTWFRDVASPKVGRITKEACGPRPVDQHRANQNQDTHSDDL